jgi:RimJ/RimL family protein N-acetyltransferase
MSYKDFQPTPWDSVIFGIPTQEIVTISAQTLGSAASTPGHYTVKIDPLQSKQLLQSYGFYYCDTLVEPYCAPATFRAYRHPQVSFTRNTPLDKLLEIAHGAFAYGRFHRDFQLSQPLADQRYDRWLTELYKAGKVFGLLFEGRLCGFIAVNENRLVLHAVSAKSRGQGLAKFLWTPVCELLFSQGYGEVSSSISMANLAALNLYSKLGFRFRNAKDIYHRLTK